MIRYLSVMMLVFGASFPVAASGVPGLEKFLGEQVTVLDDAVASASDPSEVCSADAADNEMWFFKNFFLRVRPQAGFEIPAIAKIQVVLEAELLWQRPTPQGWGAYKP